MDIDNLFLNEVDGVTEANQPQMKRRVAVTDARKAKEGENRVRSGEILFYTDPRTADIFSRFGTYAEVGYKNLYNLMVDPRSQSRLLIPGRWFYRRLHASGRSCFLRPYPLPRLDRRMDGYGRPLFGNPARHDGSYPARVVLAAVWLYQSLARPVELLHTAA